MYYWGLVWYSCEVKQVQKGSPAAWFCHHRLWEWFLEWFKVLVSYHSVFHKCQILVSSTTFMYLLFSFHGLCQIKAFPQLCFLLGIFRWRKLRAAVLILIKLHTGGLTLQFNYLKVICCSEFYLGVYCTEINKYISRCRSHFGDYYM